MSGWGGKFDDCWERLFHKMDIFACCWELCVEFFFWGGRGVEGRKKRFRWKVMTCQSWKFFLPWSKSNLLLMWLLPLSTMACSGYWCIVPTCASWGSTSCQDLNCVWNIISYKMCIPVNSSSCFIGWHLGFCLWRWLNTAEVY